MHAFVERSQDRTTVVHSSNHHFGGAAAKPYPSSPANMANYGANSPEEGLTVSTAVAIDRDKNSQYAVRYAVENLRLKEKMIVLVHVTTQDMQSRRYSCFSPSILDYSCCFILIELRI